jgi:hypothetical protein
MGSWFHLRSLRSLGTGKSAQRIHGSHILSRVAVPAPDLGRALSASVHERNGENGFVLQNGHNANRLAADALATWTRMHADKQSTRRQDKLGSFCKIPARGMQTGDREVSTNWLMERRLRYGNAGITARGWHLVGRKQRIPRSNLVMHTNSEIGGPTQEGVVRRRRLAVKIGV